MSFEDVLLQVTAAPAKIINRVPGMGSLAIGAPADIALLAIEDGKFQLIDSQKNIVTAPEADRKPSHDLPRKKDDNASEVN